MALKRLLVTSNDYDKWFDDDVVSCGKWIVERITEYIGIEKIERGE